MSGETLERAAEQRYNGLEADVLNRVHETPPEFLEQLVVDLLLTMGYGCCDATMDQVIGCFGDSDSYGKIQ